MRFLYGANVNQLGVIACMLFYFILSCFTRFVHHLYPVLLSQHVGVRLYICPERPNTQVSISLYISVYQVRITFHFESKFISVNDWSILIETRYTQEHYEKKA